jgi:tRNA(fMet)-specific endonuclease VapC
VNLTHLLDTSWLIRHLRGEAAYTRTMHRIGAIHLAISVVTLGELYEGVFRSSDPLAAEQSMRLALTDVSTLPIEPNICRIFGEHRARLRAANQLIGDIDLIIAATSLRHGLTVLTTNRVHFERIPGLQILSTPIP